MRKLLVCLAALFALITSNVARADNTALVPVVAATGLLVTELAVEGGLSTSIPAAAPIVGFFYLTFETDYKPFEAAFGKGHVFYEYPVAKKHRV